VPVLGVPLLLAGIELLAATAGAGLRNAVHGTLVTALVALAALPPLNRHWPSPPASYPLAGAAILGIAATVLYLRSRRVRTFVTVLSPAALVFPLLFLLHVPLRGSAGTALQPRSDPAPAPPAAGPVVMVVFDEFPTTALVDGTWHIDAARYPNFAALAGESTWFANATTIAGVTPPAVGALLTGRYPDPGAAGLAAQRHENLFTLLHGLYDLHVAESYVRFCPEELCSPADRPPLARRSAQLVRDLAVLFLHVITPAELRARLPDLSHPFLLLKHHIASPGAAQDALALLARQKELNEEPLARRAEEFSRFVSRIDSSRAFYYHHALLPHAPYVYLPGGSICTPGLFAQPLVWPKDDWVVLGAYQRFLFQVAFVDTLVGRLVDHLKDRGLFDSALIVIAADHGVSHRPGDQRRGTTPTNYCDILAVPLIIKAPGQRAARVVERNVEVVDVLPTIADVLGLPVPWAIDGRSALDETGAERATKRLFGPHWPGERAFFGAEGRATFPASIVPGCRDAEARRFALAWTASDPLRAGPHAPLVGRRLEELRVRETPMHRAHIEQAGLYQDVDPDGEFVPCVVAGRITLDAPAAAPAELAVAINGTVRAVTRTSGAATADAAFALTVPPAALVRGTNAVRLFVVTEEAGAPVLTPVLGGAGITYVLDDARDGTWLRAPSESGPAVRVAPGAVVGEVERLAGVGRSHARFRGWAADAEGLEPAETIVVFVDGRFHHAGSPDLARPDVAERHGRQLLRSGFQFMLPIAAAPADQEPAVRTFAISRRGTASELPLRDPGGS
jgi:hypothetical protein